MHMILILAKHMYVLRYALPPFIIFHRDFPALWGRRFALDFPWLVIEFVFAGEVKMELPARQMAIYLLKHQLYVYKCTEKYS